MGFQIVKLTDPPINVNVNVNPMGAYSNSTTYSVGDVVTYNGLSYICKQTSTGNAPTNTTYWQLIYDDTQKFITSHNGTGATLYKGTIVYFSGATGSNPNIVKAQADTDAHSAQTFGVVYEDIANNSTGKVLGFGMVDGLDTRSTATNPFTSDTLAAGDILYLSPTTAGYVTKTKPSAPDHLVYVGFVVQTSPTDGRIVYRVQNGYELDELHNVAITSVANNDSLFYDSATSLWKNRPVAATDINANVSNTEFGYLDGVTSSIQTQIDSKQASLGYTAENVANKDTDGTLAANSDTKYASQKATKTYVDTGLATKQNTLAYTPEDSANKSSSYTASSTTTYANTKALVDGLATKQNTLAYTPEDVANKDTDGTLAANSDTKYASQKATKTYADTKLAKSSNLSDVTSASTSFTNIKQDATSSSTGVVKLTNDLGGTASAPTVPQLQNTEMGGLCIIGHSWTAGVALSATGTPRFQQQGFAGRLAAMFNIHESNLKHLGIAGSYLARNTSAFGTAFSGWAGAYAFLGSYSSPNFADINSSTISVPAVAQPYPLLISHGINDAAVYSSGTTSTSHTLVRNAWKHALRATLSKHRSGAEYGNSLNTSAASTWSSNLSFSGTWSDLASTGNSSGPYIKRSNTVSDYVEFTIPTHYTGGTIAMSFIGQSATKSTISAAITSTSATSITVTSATYFPASLNYVIQIDSEQMLVTAGQGTTTWTVTRGINGTTAATHSNGADVYMPLTGIRVDFSGTASSATGSLDLQPPGILGGTLGLVKRFTCTAADAGKTIRATVAGKITNDTYSYVQFDAAWLETKEPPACVIENVARYGYTGGYAYLTPNQYSDFNTDITTIKNEFDGAVQIADVDAEWYKRGFYPNSSLNNTDVTTTVNVTVNDATTFAALGTGWVAYENSEQMLVTANSQVSGNTFSVTLTRGHGGTTKISHGTTRLISDMTWMHTDGVHPNAMGHAVRAQIIYDAFKTCQMTTYGHAIGVGVSTQNNRLTVLGFRDQHYQQIPTAGTLTANTTFTTNKLWYWAVYVADTCILDRVGIVTGTTAGTATNARFGLYDTDFYRSRPGDLIQELGTVATTSTASAAEVTCYKVLEPGWYFIGVVNQGTTAGGVRTITGANYILPTAIPKGSITTGTTLSYFLAQTGVTGSLPSGASVAPTEDTGPCPFVWTRFRVRGYI